MKSYKIIEIEYLSFYLVHLLSPIKKGTLGVNRYEFKRVLRFIFVGIIHFFLLIGVYLCRQIWAYTIEYNWT